MRSVCTTFRRLVGVVGCFAAGASLWGQVVGITPNPTGSGAQALGMGNAFVAVASDATAASWNPAGMYQLERMELSLAADYTRRKSTLGSTPHHPEIDSSEGIDVTDLNYASLVVPFMWQSEGSEGGLDGQRLALSLNYLKQYSYDFRLETRYLLGVGTPAFSNWAYRAGQEGSLSTLSPALSIELTSRFAVGVAVNIWNDSVTRSSAFASETRTVGTTAGFAVDMSQQDEYTVERGYSVTIGALYILPGDKLTLGVVYKPGFDLQLDHERRVIDSIAGTRQVVDMGSAELRMPTRIAFGVCYNPNEALFLTTDVTWTDWSEFVLSEDQGGLAGGIPGRRSYNLLTDTPIESAGRFQDTWTVRFGMEYRWFLSEAAAEETVFVPIRAGFSYDPYPGIDSQDDVFTVSLGTGLKKESWRLDLGYEHRFGNDVMVGTAGVDEFRQDLREHRVMVSLVYMFQ